MTKSLTAFAAVLAMFGAHSAFAANHSTKAHTTTTNAETCRSLEGQFDSAVKVHANAKHAKEGRAAYTEGKKLCDEGQYAEGAAKLHTALKDLGVKANSKMH